jgi:predicted dehydrogenase
MRMNLNQQSSGPSWTWHKNLMDSLSPLVDCGVHYVDVMCQMTGAKPVRVHGIGAHLSNEVKVYNYGALQVVFDDGSVGWYEAGWGPMMSEIAFFVKDVVGPKGCVSIVVPQDGQTEAKLDAISTSADIDSHVKTNALKIHLPTSTRTTTSPSATWSGWTTSGRRAVQSRAGLVPEGDPRLSTSPIDGRYGQLVEDRARRRRNIRTKRRSSEPGREKPGWLAPSQLGWLAPASRSAFPRGRYDDIAAQIEEWYRWRSLRCRCCRFPGCRSITVTAFGG